MNAAALFDAVFRRAEAGRAAPLMVRHASGGVHRFDPAAWCGEAMPGDDALLLRCTGPTLDVGCGPGRLVAALTRAGRPALGIDISAAAVRLARRRGAAVLRRDVFDPLPGTGRWHHVMLADGNIGIGGDPAALLRRVTRLIAADGDVLVELEPPGHGLRHERVRLRPGHADVAWFTWAWVGVDAIAQVALRAGLRVAWTARHGHRWFARLERS